MTAQVFFFSELPRKSPAASHLLLHEQAGAHRNGVLQRGDSTHFFRVPLGSFLLRLIDRYTSSLRPPGVLQRGVRTEFARGVTRIRVTFSDYSLKAVSAL